MDGPGRSTRPGHTPSDVIRRGTSSSTTPECRGGTPRSAGAAAVGSSRTMAAPTARSYRGSGSTSWRSALARRSTWATRPTDRWSASPAARPPRRRRRPSPSSSRTPPRARTPAGRRPHRPRSSRHRRPADPAAGPRWWRGGAAGLRRPQPDHVPPVLTRPRHAHRPRPGERAGRLRPPGLAQPRRVPRDARRPLRDPRPGLAQRHLRQRSADRQGRLAAARPERHRRRRSLDVPPGRRPSRGVRRHR